MHKLDQLLLGLRLNTEASVTGCMLLLHAIGRPDVWVHVHVQVHVHVHVTLNLAKVAVVSLLQNPSRCGALRVEDAMRPTAFTSMCADAT